MQFGGLSEQNGQIYACGDGVEIGWASQER